MQLCYNASIENSIVLYVPVYGKIFVVKTFCIIFSSQLIFVGQATHVRTKIGSHGTTRLGDIVAEHEKLCMCGYHIYQDVQVAAVVQRLLCLRDKLNSHETYTLAVKKNSIVGRERAFRVWQTINW